MAWAWRLGHWALRSAQYQSAEGRGNLRRRRSAGAAGEDAEESLDIGVGGRVAVAVEVGVARARGGRAVAGEAGEERLDVGVGPAVAVAVEVGGAAGLDVDRGGDDEGRAADAAACLVHVPPPIDLSLAGARVAVAEAPRRGVDREGSRRGVVA